MGKTISIKPSSLTELLHKRFMLMNETWKLTSHSSEHWWVFDMLPGSLQYPSVDIDPQCYSMHFSIDALLLFSIFCVFELRPFYDLVGYVGILTWKLEILDGWTKNLRLMQSWYLEAPPSSSVDSEPFCCRRRVNERVIGPGLKKIWIRKNTLTGTSSLTVENHQAHPVFLTHLV